MKKISPKILVRGEEWMSSMKITKEKLSVVLKTLINEFRRLFRSLFGFFFYGFYVMRFSVTVDYEI